MAKNLIEEYFEYQKFYEKKYGKSSPIIIAMMVGSFYEFYGIDNEEEKIGHVKEISQELNILMTRRNKSILKNSISNPLMAGIPIISWERYLEVLVKLNKYTIVIIDQVTEPPNPKREVVEILSPGTYLNYKGKDSNNILSIFLQGEKNNKFTIGAASVDISTGKTVTFETYSLKNDNDYAFSEIERFIETNYPKEIIINVKNSPLNEKEILQKLNINNTVYHFNDIENQNDFLKLSYQEELLSSIFENNSMLSTIELLNFENKLIMLNSFVFLLNFIYEHNHDSIKKLQTPLIWEENKFLNLANNAIYQLDIISKNENKQNNISSLFDILNKTSTAMGNRLLKFRLLNPFLDIEYIENIYNDIKQLLPLYNDIEIYLKEVYDLERLHRKMELNKINPSEMSLIYSSLQSIFNIYLFIKNKNINFKSFNIFDINKFNEFCNILTSTFNINELSKHNLNDINGNFFKEGVNNEIDDIENEIKEYKKIYSKVEEYLNSFCKDKYFKIEFNQKEGYFFYITNNKFKEFEQNFHFKEFKFKLNNKEEFFDINKRNITTLKSNKKIYFKEFHNINTHILYLENKLYKLVKEEFINQINRLNNYQELLYSLIQYVSNIDVIKRNAKCAHFFKYTKPIINKDKKSFINIKNLSHPIIEVLEDDIEYVANDILLNDDNRGMLITGVNASGKSSLQKSIGLSIIMAQAGMFVPATYMEFSPFKKIYTRISGNDNLFKGLSSFAIEMIELRNILKNSDENTLVIGDEISHGTETISGISIVSSALIHLHEKKRKFIFATHLHEIFELKEIQNLKNLNFFHLKVKFDEKTENLIYYRKLQHGPGERIYGLEVAKAMNLDSDFINTAYKIRKNIINSKLLHKNDLIFDNKKSNYNNEIIMESCRFCNNKSEDTHHIIEQHIFNNKKQNEQQRIKKNSKFNLVNVCGFHHKLIHKILNKNPQFLGNKGMKYIETGNGKKLWINPELKPLINIEINKLKNIL